MPDIIRNFLMVGKTLVKISYRFRNFNYYFQFHFKLLQKQNLLTFLLFQMSGKNREEAELSFMEVAVDLEERQGLNQEIQENILRNRKRREEEGEGLASGDEWVDHSDMEDN